MGYEIPVWEWNSELRMVMKIEVPELNAAAAAWGICLGWEECAAKTIFRAGVLTTRMLHVSCSCCLQLVVCGQPQTDDSTACMNLSSKDRARRKIVFFLLKIQKRIKVDVKATRECWQWNVKTEMVPWFQMRTCAMQARVRYSFCFWSRTTTTTTKVYPHRRAHDVHDVFLVPLVLCKKFSCFCTCANVQMEIANNTGNPAWQCCLFCTTDRQANLWFE